MIKKAFVICDVVLAASALSTVLISDAYGQAPTPVTCVTGCNGGGVVTGTVTVNNINSNGQATMANSSPVALASNQSVADPCMFQAKTNVPVAVITAISVQLVALSTGKVVYVCSLAFIGSTATVFSLTTGTGTACATGAAAVMGAATATNGVSLAANGGLTLGNGSGTVALGATSSELCLIQSGGGTISGNLTIVQQ